MKQISGVKLRAWRQHQHRSIESVARDLGVSYVTLQKWETNKRKIGISPLGYNALLRLGYTE